MQIIKEGRLFWSRRTESFTESEGFGTCLEQLTGSRIALRFLDPRAGRGLFEPWAITFLSDPENTQKLCYACGALSAYPGTSASVLSLQPLKTRRFKKGRLNLTI